MPFVQHLAVEVAEGVLPEELLAREGELLQFPVGADEQMRRRRLETHPALDAQDGVAQMHAAADAVLPAEGIQLRDQCHRIQGLAVHGLGHALLEPERELPGLEAGSVDLSAGECGLRQLRSRNPGSRARPRRCPTCLRSRSNGRSSPGTRSHASSGTASPGHGSRPSVRMGVMSSSSGASARKATSKRTWSLPAPVEPWARAVAPSCFASATTLAAWHTRSAETLKGIEVAAQHVAVHEVAQIAVEEFRTRVQGVMGLARRAWARALSMRFNSAALKPPVFTVTVVTCVTLFPEMDHAEGGIQAAGERQHHMFLHFTSTT